jgi:hypothetical protein
VSATIRTSVIVGESSASLRHSARAYRSAPAEDRAALLFRPLLRENPPVATRLVCLLPARNCERDLPEYFASAMRFADAVVALDDGSTDRTRELLEAHPLVEVVLANPRRDGYREWDDGANRARLLAAASELEPDWVLSLDADERIDEGDARALREFIAGDALPQCAYGLRLFRMREDLSHYERGNNWVFRLFAYEPGQRFAYERLHICPIPLSIPRERWLLTTLRVQHVGGATETRRHARYAKYREADPDNRYQRGYANLLEPLGGVHPWAPRPEGLPVLHDAARADELEPLGLGVP